MSVDIGCFQYIFRNMYMLIILVLHFMDTFIYKDDD